MKAVQISRHGKPVEVVEVVDLPEPDGPAPGEVLAAIEYAPINFSALLAIMAQYPILPASFPAVVGNEGVARVLAAGKGVKGLKPGDRVLVPPAQASWRERIVLPATGLFALPSGADPQQLSMLSINPPTAALILSEYVDLKAGDWVIQNAANSGVGRSVIAIAKSRGLRTVNVVRRAELIDELVQKGGDVVLLDGPDLAARVAKATNSASIKLAIDAIAGESSAVLASCLAPGGALVLYSFLSRQPVLTRGSDLIFRDVAVRGFWLYAPQFRESPKAVEAIKLGARLVAEGKLAVPVAAKYPLTSAASAVGHALKGGKVLFEISPEQVERAQL